MQCIQINSFGRPWEIVKVIRQPDVGSPAAGEIVIEMEYSPINPSDLVLMRGFYGIKPELPALVGSEGVARVVKVGSDIAHLKEGDRVLFPPGMPTWASRSRVKAGGLFALPAYGNPQQLSMLAVNPPTAYLMLTEYVPLERGDRILQTAGNSGVGRAVIAIARKLGLHTISVVRRPELLEELKALGADAVVVEGPDLVKRVAETTGKAKIKLALDCVGGPGLMSVNDCLADGGALVVYGVMSGAPGPFLTAANIFRDLTLRGVWLDRWHKVNSAARILEVQKMLSDWVADFLPSL
jgi:trans-2-enoyl-CoA reductase